MANPLSPNFGIGSELFEAMLHPLPPGRGNRALTDEMHHRFPPDVPFVRGGQVLEFLTLIRPMRTPFPMFKLKARVLEQRVVGSGDGIWAFEVTLSADVQIFDRDHPERPPSPLTFMEGKVVPLDRATPRFLLFHTRDFISRAILHELDENFFVGDARCFDPHDEQLVKRESDFGSHIP